MKKKAILGLCLVMALSLSACGTSKEAQAVIDNINTIEEIEVSDIDVIKETLEMYNALTDEQKEEVENYATLQEAEKKLPELEKEYAIQNDKTPPTFSGFKENETIKVKCGTDFNLNDYLKKELKVTDDVTEGDLEYQTELDKKVYDSITGKVDTQEYGEYPIVLSAKDEAGNEGKLNLKLKLNPIHVSKKHPTPTVYDGEYGTIKIRSFTHGNEYGENQYKVVFDVENKTDNSIEVYLPYTTSINGYQVGASYEAISIASGLKGTMEAYIEDDDIPDEVGKYSTIDSEVCVCDKGSDSPFLGIPIIFDVNVSK